MNINEFSFDEKIKSICLINEAIELAQGDAKSIEALKAVKALIQSEIDLSSLEANKLEENGSGFIKFNWDWNSETHTSQQEIEFNLYILECAFQQRANMARFQNPYREPILQEYSVMFGHKPSMISNDFTL